MLSRAGNGLTAFDIVVLGQHTALAVFTLDESRTVTSQVSDSKELLAGGFAETERASIQERFLGHTGFRYSLQDSDGDSADYPTLLYNNG
ncbi:heat-inducible transcription repressor [Streptococcus pneumoniae]|nr:heat-inducible transcription repressor [Streptococcus pneumoniae]